MIILIVGLLRYDSGKTTWALELIEAFKNVGLKPYPYKPIGAHNAWYQYETLVNSIRLGRLVGEDAYRLASAAGLVDQVEILSPVDILSAPLDPEKFMATSMKRYVEELSFLETQAILARTTVVDDTWRPRSVHYLITENLDRIISSLKDDVMMFLKKIKTFVEINRDEFLSLISSPKLYESLAKIQNMLKRKTNLLIIESYNNAALPTPSAIESDYVFVVAPGKVFMYKGSDYAKAINVYGSLSTPLSIDVPSIMNLLKKPILVFNWRPLMLGKEYETSVSPSAEKAVEYLTRR